MVYNTTQQLPPTATHCLYILYVYFVKGGRGGGGQREGRGATVHKRGRKYQQELLYLQSINSIKHQWRRHGLNYLEVFMFRLGSDVLDKARNVTQKCVIVKICLFLEDGSESQKRYSLFNFSFCFLKTFDKLIFCLSFDQRYSNEQNQKCSNCMTMVAQTNNKNLYFIRPSNSRLYRRADSFEDILTVTHNLQVGLLFTL